MYSIEKETKDSYSLKVIQGRRLGISFVRRASAESECLAAHRDSEDSAPCVRNRDSIEEQADWASAHYTVFGVIVGSTVILIV